jgi:hypothetical protein
MDITRQSIEEVLAAYKKKEKESKREYDEFVENLELERLRVQKEIEEEYSKYIDDEEAWEKYLDEHERGYEEDLQEGNYIFFFRFFKFFLK